MTKCEACRDGVTKPMRFSMAFQPIVDVQEDRVYAYEALVRGPNGEDARSVLSQVTSSNLYAFDQSCRVEAITMANRLGLDKTGALLSINFLPGAVYSPAACIQLTLKTAHDLGFPTECLIFEITEGEKVRDAGHLEAITSEYERQGFQVAIDDFGAGFANLNLLADLSVSIIKLDTSLVRRVHLRPKARAIVSAITTLCDSLGIKVVGEGVETVEEFDVLRRCGVRWMQGFLLARPSFQSLPAYTLPMESTIFNTASRTTATFPLIGGGAA